MTADDVAAALRAAGFEGVEIQADTLFARAGGPASPEFQVQFDGVWWFTLCRPVRANAAALESWAKANPGTRVDIFQGEVRLSLRSERPDAATLLLWANLAQDFTAQAVVWRRAQRARGEGM